jgi:hypothetical protein
VLPPGICSGSRVGARRSASRWGLAGESAGFARIFWEKNIGGAGSGRRPAGQKEEHISVEDASVAVRCQIAPTSSAIRMDGVDGIMLTLSLDEDSLPDDVLCELGKMRQRGLYLFLTTKLPDVQPGG